MCKLAQIISTLRLLNYAYCDACNPFFFPIAQRLFRRFSWGDFTLYVRLVSDELLETLTKNPKKLVAKSRLDCSRTTEAPIGKNQSPRCFFKVLGVFLNPHGFIYVTCFPAKRDLTKNFLNSIGQLFPPQVGGRGIHEGSDIQRLPRLESPGIRGTTKAATRSETDQRVPWCFQGSNFWLVGWLELQISHFCR